MNSIATQLPYAVDGNAGGTYALSGPLTFSGQVVTISGGLVAPTVTGATAFADQVTINDDLGVTGTTTTADLLVTDDATVTDDLAVGDDLTVGGGAIVTGSVLAASYTGPLVSVDVVRCLEHLRLSAATGPAGTANLTVGGNSQLLYADSLSGDTIYTILDTGAGDGNFFLIFNRSVGFVLTINAPIGTIATITYGNCAMCWRNGTIWRGQVLSAT